MSRHAIFIVSTDAPMPAQFDELQSQGLVHPVRQDRLTPEIIASAAGLIATASVDQIDLLSKRDAIVKLLDTGGRMVVNGHVMRPFIDGLETFATLQHPGRASYTLTRLVAHPVFDDIPAKALETNRGVAGFYGRGYNPPPPGAIAITGIGPDQLPVDWVWQRPAGGSLFVHSGNDLWGVGDDAQIKKKIAERLVGWCRAASRTEAFA